MGKITYNSLKLKRDKSVKTLSCNEQEIEVLQYLPFEDKYDLIKITLQRSFENGIYDPMKTEMFFYLYIVYLYTNITFTEKQQEDEIKLYDTLCSNNLIDKIITLIPENEYNFLLNMLNEEIEVNTKYKMSAAGVLNSFMTQMPIDAEAAARIVDNFDPQQYQAVVDFAEAANGNRPIRKATVPESE